MNGDEGKLDEQLTKRGINALRENGFTDRRSFLGVPGAGALLASLGHAADLLGSVSSQVKVSQLQETGRNIMQTPQEHHSTAPWLVHHPCSAEDQAAMAAMRAIVEPNKGKLQGVAARVPFDAIMEHVAAPAGVVYDADRVGGVSGWWCRPQAARPGQAVMHIHGGWFNWGSAQAFRHLAGHIAASAGVAAFVPDYRLAPEHPFPAASEDVRACYVGLTERGFSKIAITGDSAGGNLTIELLVRLATKKASGSEALVGGVALSPVTDLAFCRSILHSAASSRAGAVLSGWT
jgi:acetyl esterase/lipase